MPFKRWVVFLSLWLFLCSALFAPGISFAQDKVDRQAYNELLDTLEKKIEDADQRMIAHPKFLEELRALVKKYRSKLRKIFFSEDFSDNEFTKNPNWVVDSGEFKITPSQRLWSRVSFERPQAAPSSEKPQEEANPFNVLLQELIKSKLEEKSSEEKSTPKKATAASIHALAKIGPAYELDLVMVSESQWGSMEIVLLGGSPPTPRYRMVYHAAPSADRPIQIIRERGSRSYIIESATQYPALDDGVPHKVKWIRDFQGNMKVFVDGKEVLSTVEVFYRTDFIGLALLNRGGTYEWGAIQILEPTKE